MAMTDLAFLRVDRVAKRFECRCWAVQERGDGGRAGAVLAARLVGRT